MKDNYSWQHNQCNKKDDLHLENMTSAKRRAIILWKYEDQHKEENGCNLKIRRPTWKGRQLQLENMKINMKRRMGIVENMKTNAKRRTIAIWEHENQCKKEVGCNMKTNAKKMGVDWKQEDQHEKDILHLENKKTNAKKRIVVPYSLKTQRPMWKEKGPIGKHLQKTTIVNFTI